jgi:flagella basal body P-ring formation protein FlgA
MPRAINTYIRLILLDFIKMNGAKTTRYLPHSGPRGKTGGSPLSPRHPKRISAHWCAGLLLLLLPLTSSANQQVDQAIQQHLEALMRPIAQREAWNGLRITHNTALGSTPPANCQQPLSVRGGVANSSRQRLTLTCPDQPGWRLQVATDMQLWLPVLVTTRVIDRGEAITAADVKRQEIDINKAPRGFYHHLTQITGMGAKRRIRANQLLSPTLIAQPLAIKRGDKIKIVATQDGISASMSGEALENGSKGEVIRVKNISSNKTIEAKVLGSGEVASIF